ncbi:ISAs1 family transposase [Paenibacillus sp. TRM 82003]|nr:ISAs1 family transposase [Paenibacillus sp. TRM 82003]
MASTLMSILRTVADPRSRSGRRHHLPGILALAICAVLAGTRNYTQIHAWTRDIDDTTRAALELTTVLPSETTIRKTLQRLDADTLDLTLGAWIQSRLNATTIPGHRRVIAVDGKAVRGSATRTAVARFLMSAVDTTRGVVLGQVDVGAKTNEIPLFATLLDTLQDTDLNGAVITADALHTQRAHARYLYEHHGAHYLFTVKRNQPTLHDQLAALPWGRIHQQHASSERSHGRQEERFVKAVTIATGIGFDHAEQAVRIVRRRRETPTSAWTSETVYAVTSLTSAQANLETLAGYLRAHWCIENRVHWVRDVTFDEDRCRIRTGSGPQVMATLRNLAITVLRLAGHTNIAAALAHHARRPWRPLQTLAGM